MISGNDGNLQASDVTAEEIGMLAGLTGNVQEQITGILNGLQAAKIERHDFYNESDSVKFLNGYGDKIGVGYHYKVIVGNYYGSNDKLSGYIWLVDGMLMQPKYEWQMARSYRGDTGASYYRTRYNDVWTDWRSMLIQ